MRADADFEACVWGIEAKLPARSRSWGPGSSGIPAQTQRLVVDTLVAWPVSAATATGITLAVDVNGPTAGLARSNEGLLSVSPQPNR